MDESVHGASEVIAGLIRMAGESSVAAELIVKRAQVLVEGEAKKAFTGAHPRGMPTGSAPGTAPDVVTGTLRRSIMSSATETVDGGAVGRVYPTAIYARIQELGGQTGRGGATTLPARPYLQPAYEASKPRISQIAAEEWARIL